MTTDRILAEKVMGWVYIEWPAHLTGAKPSWGTGKCPPEGTGCHVIDCEDWKPSENPSQLDQCFKKAGYTKTYRAFDQWCRSRYYSLRGESADAVTCWQLAPTKEKADALAKAVREEG